MFLIELLYFISFMRKLKIENVNSMNDCKIKIS